MPWVPLPVPGAPNKSRDLYTTITVIEPNLQRYAIPTLADSRKRPINRDHESIKSCSGRGSERVSPQPRKADQRRNSRPPRAYPFFPHSVGMTESSPAIYRRVYDRKEKRPVGTPDRSANYSISSSSVPTETSAKLDQYPFRNPEGIVTILAGG